jgi:hypothetical protein
VFCSCHALAGHSALDLSCEGLGLLCCDVLFRIDFEEMVQDNEDHGGASEEDGEGVELVVGYHLGGAFGALACRAL